MSQMSQISDQEVEQHQNTQEPQDENDSGDERDERDADEEGEGDGDGDGDGGGGDDDEDGDEDAEGDEIEDKELTWDGTAEGTENRLPGLLKEMASVQRGFEDLPTVENMVQTGNVDADARETITLKLSSQGLKLKQEDPQWHRKGSLPFIRNAMPHCIGSWMGDGIGIMQWPMPSDEYKEQLREVIALNKVTVIVALGFPPANVGQFWEQWGDPKLSYHAIKHWESQMGYAENESVRKSIVPIFQHIYEEVAQGRRVLIHCKDGGALSVRFYLYYLAWAGRLKTDNFWWQCTVVHSLRSHSFDQGSDIVVLAKFTLRETTEVNEKKNKSQSSLKKISTDPREQSRFKGQKLNALGQPSPPAPRISPFLVFGLSYVEGPDVVDVDPVGHPGPDALPDPIGNNPDKENQQTENGHENGHGHSKHESPKLIQRVGAHKGGVGCESIPPGSGSTRPPPGSVSIPIAPSEQEEEIKTGRRKESDEYLQPNDKSSHPGSPGRGGKNPRNEKKAGGGRREKDVVELGVNGRGRKEQDEDNGGIRSRKPHRHHHHHPYQQQQTKTDYSAFPYQSSDDSRSEHGDDDPLVHHSEEEEGGGDNENDHGALSRSSSLSASSSSSSVVCYIWEKVRLASLVLWYGACAVCVVVLLSQAYPTLVKHSRFSVYAECVVLALLSIKSGSFSAQLLSLRRQKQYRKCSVTEHPDFNDVVEILLFPFLAVANLVTITGGLTGDEQFIVALYLTCVFLYFVVMMATHPSSDSSELTLMQGGSRPSSYKKSSRVLEIIACVVGIVDLLVIVALSAFSGIWLRDVITRHSMLGVSALCVLLARVCDSRLIDWIRPFWYVSVAVVLTPSEAWIPYRP